MSKCPRCFVPLPPDVWAFTETEPALPDIDDVASAYLGHPVQMGPVNVIQTAPGAAPTQEQACAGLGSEQVREVCPTCHYPLPLHLRSGQNICIAMAGARFTGKTVYIAVLVKLLERLLQTYNQELTFATPETAKRYRYFYEKPLFEERGLIEPTAGILTAESYQHHPLVFNIGRWHGIPRYLSIRDVAGEDLERPDIAGVPWKFFSVADAVLFLFDPMRVQEIREQLRDLVPTDHSTGGDPREVLRTVMRLIGNGDPKLAIILSKFDALQALRRVTSSWWGQVMTHAGAAFSRDPGLVGAKYDQVDGLSLHIEVKSLLEKLDAGSTLLNVTDPINGRSFDHRFFAVSALGDSPQGSRLSHNGISPFRCGDPVRWVLAEQQIL